MSRKRVLLDSAEFLDSRQAQTLTEAGVRELRRQAELFFTVCYEELGKRPELVDGQDMQAVLCEHLPSRLKRRDALAESLPDVLGAILDHLESSRSLRFAFEARMACESHLERFHALVESGELAGQRGGPSAGTAVNRVEKLGRNDPCFCGSGKKFKKCHGKTE